MDESRVLGFSSLYGVVAEMRTPLAEIQMLLDAGKLKEGREVISQTLELFNGFLYAQRLEASEEDLNFSPHSLAASTEHILHKVTPFARLYDVSLDFKTSAKKINVNLSQPAFNHATFGLLYSLISFLQNKKKARLGIRTACKEVATLRFFSSDLEIFQKHNLSSSTKLNPHASGLGSGLILANSIYRQIGSRLSFVANQHGRGLSVDFKTTRQMTLVESLA